MHVFRRALRTGNKDAEREEEEMEGSERTERDPTKADVLNIKAGGEWSKLNLRASNNNLQYCWRVTAGYDRFNIAPFKDVWRILWRAGSAAADTLRSITRH